MAALIQIVDENDQPLRAGTKQEAWRDGLRHRVVRIMIDDGSGNFLLQKRVGTKPIYPDCWDNSVAGHVDAGETYEQAAARELKEELGLTGCHLDEVDYYPTQGSFEGKKLNRFNKLYKVIVSRDVRLKLQPEEVADAQWFTRAELLQLADGKLQASDGIIEAADRLRKL